ncbi:MAG: TetR/AcrR family transcriptional regulator, partial [Burkholderiales bacterium]
MNAVLSPISLARQPLQQRAKDRFENVLDAAEALLLETGLDGFSIPELAKRLGYTRASIYKFFPTPAAVLNELVKRDLKRMERMLYRVAPQLLTLTWTEAAQAVAAHATDFFNSHLIARLLTLGGHLNDDSYHAQQQTIQHLGQFLRQLTQ